MKHIGVGVASIVALTTATGTVRAQEALSAPTGQVADEGAVEDIVVTAQKREQSLLDTPLAISAFGEAALERLQVRDVAGLAAIAPGLQGAAVSSGQPLISIRGIGSNDFSVGNDPAVGIFIDEVYAGRSAGALTNLFDVARVEVVRGPQGTLFGRNTTAGAIAIVRNAPSDSFEGNAALTAASRGEVIAEGVVSGPVAPGVSLRAGAYFRQRDGLIEQVPSGDKLGEIESFSGRLAARIEPAPGMRFDLGFDYQRDRSSSAIYQSRSYNGAIAGLGFYQSTTNLSADELRNDRDIYLGSLKTTFDLGDVTLTSISAYRTYRFGYKEDTDGGPANLLAFSIDEEQDAWSQELRLNYTSDRLDLFVGASYFSEKLDQTTRANYNEEDICGAVARGSVGTTLACGPLLNGLSGGLVPSSFVGLPSVTDVNNARAHYESWGLYTDVTFRATDSLRIILGLRYSRDDKKVTIFNPAPVSSVAPLLLGSPTVFLESTTVPVFLEKSWDNWSPRAVVQYDVNDDLMIYASASRGYKSGGFNLLVPSGGAFAPEIVTSFESGAKAKLADGRLTFDVAGFYYIYEDLQVQIVNAFPITENAGKARGYGIETSFQARPVSGLRLGGSLTLLNADYTRYSPATGVSYKGNSLNGAPRFSAALQGEYSFAAGLGEIMAGAAFRYRSKEFHSPDNAVIKSSPAYSVTDFHVTWAPNPDFRLTAFVSNAFGEKYVTQTQQLEALGIAVFQAGERCTFGARLNVDF